MTIRIEGGCLIFRNQTKFPVHEHQFWSKSYSIINGKCLFSYRSRISYDNKWSQAEASNQSRDCERSIKWKVKSELRNEKMLDVEKAIKT